MFVKIRKILAVLLISAVFASFFAMNASAAPIHYDRYVALGDDVTAGIGLVAFDADAKYAWTAGSYAEILRGNIGAEKADSFMGARSGWRTHELRIALEPGYVGDAFTVEFLNAWSDDKLSDIFAARAAYGAAIRDADLITIQIGGNDLVARAVYTVMSFMEKNAAGTQNEAAVKAAIEQAKKQGTAELALSFLMSEVKTLSDYATIFIELTKAVTEAVNDLKENWDAIIGRILDVNPDADIVVIGVYNSTGTKLTDTLKIFFDPFCDTINNYYRYSCKYCQNYSFVDISSIAMLSGNTTDGVRPNEKGHKVIADRIFDALTSYVHCAHEHTEIINAAPATASTPGYTGDEVCSDCGALIEQGAVIVLGGTISVPKNIGAQLSGIVSVILRGVLNTLGSIFESIFPDGLPKIDFNINVPQIQNGTTEAHGMN